MLNLILTVIITTALQTVLSQNPDAQYFIVAPNIVRVDVEETILVNVVNLAPAGVQVPVTLYFELTHDGERISEETVMVGNNDPVETKLRLPRNKVPEQVTAGKQFVTLVARSASAQLRFVEKKVILLSDQAGFVFVQSDKPIYNPKQTVNIRGISLNQDMHPSRHEVKVDIKNPNNIIIYRYNKNTTNGFFTIQFRFPSFPVFGNWTIIAYYGHKFAASASVQFEVKEYVLPKFSIEVKTQYNYILQETDSLITFVSAKYVFGDPVRGKYYIKYGVVDDGNLTILQEKQGLLSTGEVDRALDMARVEVPFESLIGKRLLIQVYISESATGETSNVNNTDVVFTRTPYKFNWDGTQHHFKKALPFAVLATVHFVNGLPAPTVPVAVTATATLSDTSKIELEGGSGLGGDGALIINSGPEGQIHFRLDIPEEAIEVKIHLKTVRDDLIDGNADSWLTVTPQESTDKEYLLIRLPMTSDNSLKQKIGTQSTVEVELTHRDRVSVLYYFVIAGGRIVRTGTKQLAINSNIALGFQITYSMAPSSRIVAYYINPNGDIIADSLLIEVEEKCENQVIVQFEGLRSEHGTFFTSGSNKQVRLRVSANELTTVGLIAVDEAVFALRKFHRLTQKKVFARKAGYDLGCGPGGGMTMAEIFKGAGVAVLTSYNLDVPQREAASCPRTANSRKRRAISKSEQLSLYDGIEREYCAKGLRILAGPSFYSCSQRADAMALRKHLNLTSPEIKAFYICCRNSANDNQGGRIDDGNEEFDQDLLEDVAVRTHFKENWIFTTVDTKDNDVVFHDETLLDSVTTWVVEAVGISEDYDMCVANPVRLQVRPTFFLDLSMPYSVQRMEQIEIVVSIYNYASVELTINVYLKGAEGLCSKAQPGRYSKPVTITIQPKQPGSVTFVVVPLRADNVPIEVVAVTNSSTQNMYRDAIRKLLSVRSEGYKERVTKTLIVDPQNRRNSPIINSAVRENESISHTRFWGNSGENRQIDRIEYTLNNGTISDTTEVRVSMIGNVMGTVVQTVLGGLDNLLGIPKGCGEQTMINLAPNVYIYRYLRHSNQLSGSLEASTMQFIGDGVAQELTHRRPDGGFSVWGDNTKYPSSTWLTAFVSRVLCQARDFAHVDPEITCKSMEWLMDPDRQNEDGSFREIYRVHHADMTGGVQTGASLTAFVLISLLECKCAEIDPSNSIASATRFLELELPALTRPYDLAITTYALIMANSIKAEEALDRLRDIATYDEETKFRHWEVDDSSFSDDSQTYWYKNRPAAIEVEITSYALLSVLRTDDIQYAHAIVNWLTSKENYGGGFYSTQDTVVALHALSEYAIKSQGNKININCQMTLRENNYQSDFRLTPENAIILQQQKIQLPSDPTIGLLFESEGEGQGQLKFESSYHLPEPNGRCDFILNVDVAERSGEGKVMDSEDIDSGYDRSKVGRDKRQADFSRGRAAGTLSEYILTYTINVSFLRRERTGMAIIDVGLFTGFKPIVEDLENAKTNSGGNIPRFEFSDRSVIFYLDSIQRDVSTTITFGAKRMYLVGMIQPVPIRVYDYYNPSWECTKFAHPIVNSERLSTICEGDVCTCAAGVCAKNPLSPNKDFDFTKLKRDACISSSHFAYEVRLSEKKPKGTLIMFKMEIVTPIKQGLDPVFADDTRYFLMSRSCRSTPTLKKSKTYLVIGSGGIQINNGMGSPSYKYVIDERMSFYELPKQKPKWQNLLNTFMDFKDDLISGAGCAL